MVEEIVQNVENRRFRLNEFLQVLRMKVVTVHVDSGQENRFHLIVPKLVGWLMGGNQNLKKRTRQDLYVFPFRFPLCTVPVEHVTPLASAQNDSKTSVHSTLLPAHRLNLAHWTTDDRLTLSLAYFSWLPENRESCLFGKVSFFLRLLN